MKFSLCPALLAALAILVSAESRAGEHFIILNGVSYHIDSSYEWNENNTGLGFEYESARSSRWSQRLVVNGFRDSNEDLSYMVGAGLHRTLFTIERLDEFSVSAGATAFLMSRKDANGGQLFPGILPSLTVGNRHYGINLTYLPRMAIEKMSGAFVNDPTLDGVVFLQFRVGASRFYQVD